MDFLSFLIFGVLIGLLEVYRQSMGVPGERLARVDDAILLLSFALIGARLDYTLLRWSYFSQHLTEIPRFWLGGLGWPGAVCGGLFAIALTGFLRHGTSRRGIADAMLPLICPLAVAVWLGAWAQNAAYGIVLPAQTWYGVLVPEITGTVISRFPIQPVSAFLLVAFCALGQRISDGCQIPGRHISTGFLAFSIVMLGSTFLRADPVPIWLGLRYETWFAAAFTLVGLAGYIGTCLWQSNFRVPQTSNTI